jgi:hypothetical protein
MTDPNVYKASGFHKFLGKLIDLSPLGKGFSSFFPIFILVPVMATAFGLYGKIKNICGFGDLLEDEDEDGAGGYAGTGSWREGRALIERELQGNGGGSLGLAQRTTSPPNERYTDTTPSSSAPLISNSIADTTSPSASSSRPRPERRRPVIEDDDESNFFDTFATRWKNTFDTADFSFKRPAWMGGEEEVESGRGRGEERGSGFLGLFGGRPEEGRVRL